MRRKSLLERVRLLGRSAIDVLAVLGRSCLFLFHALVGRGGIGGGFQLLTIGILGKYIGKIFMETKHRPIYVIKEKSK